jgi:hypothetical protein
MWILRFLNGPLAGQIVPLTKHSTLLGRAPNCDVKLPSGNVSKEHTRIEVFDDKLIISDAGSRNGTFLNGIQIRSSKAKSGDKIAVHDIIFEVQQVPENWRPQFNNPYAAYGTPAGRSGGQIAGNVAYQMHPGYAPEPPEDAPAGSPLAGLMQDKLPRWTAQSQAYMERVVLPGVYRLPEMFEFKWVLAGMMAVFILMVTALSTVPLIRILKASIEEESQQHAMTIATTLARVNIPALAQGLDSGVNVDIAASRPGVKKAYILSNVDGNIIAPAAQAGVFPDLPYVHEGRKLDKESVKQVDDNTVVAMVPVRFYNAETGSQAITAWAVVHYDMSSLAVDNSQVLSLFITTLFISLLLGFVLFYFLYKMIEHPIREMNVQLDTALKEGHETVSVRYMFPALQLLVSNVSSALSRAVNGSEQNQGPRALEHDRNREVANLVELIGFAAMGVRAEDLSVAAANQAFESRIGMSAAQLTTLSVNEINDQALKLSVKDLIERLDQNPDELASNELEFSGLNFQVVAQAIYGSAKIAYYLIVLLPKEGEG